MPEFTGSTEPYPANGISKIPCARCKQPSRYQWQACANDRRYIPLCTVCDAALNEQVLIFIGVPNTAELMSWYRHQQTL